MSTAKKILIVEDEAPLLNILRDKLTLEGFAVLEAKNGKQGLEIAMAEHPDLILLDILLPVKDGLTMAKELRDDRWGKNANIIFLTNLDGNDKIAESLKVKAFEYIIKSDRKIEDIIADIKQHLEA